MRFYPKMVVLFLTSVFLPLFLCSVLLITHTVRVSGERTAAAIQNSFQQTYSVLDAQFGQIKKFANLLLNDADVNAFLRSGKTDYSFREQLDFKADMENTISFIENTKDVQRLRIYVDSSLVYIPDRKNYFNIAKLEDQAWFSVLGGDRYRSLWLSESENSISEQSQDATLSYVVKGVNMNDFGETAAVFQLDFSKDEMEQQLLDCLVLDGSRAFVADDSGRVIAGSSLGGQTVMTKLPEDIAEKDTVEIDSTLYSVSCADFKNAPWHMVTLVPNKSLFSFSDLDNVLLFLLIAFFLADIILITTLRFSRKVTQKLRSVADGMEAAQHGEFRNLPKTKTHDEIDDLVDRYNYMVDELSLLVEEKYLSGQKLKAAQLKALQGQINPHFLYNTLDLINSYAYLDDPQKVEELVSALSSFYRLSLNHGQDVYQLWQELKLVEAYFEIQKIRYPGCLNLTIDVPAALMQYNIPNITLQPLIENSVSHGIMARADKKGTVQVVGRAGESAVVLKVIDDGVGIDDEMLKLLNSGDPLEENDISAAHYGIFNINARIQNYYGEGAGLHFESEKGAGTTVTITLPPM